MKLFCHFLKAYVHCRCILDQTVGIQTLLRQKASLLLILCHAVWLFCRLVHTIYVTLQSMLISDNTLKFFNINLKINHGFFYKISILIHHEVFKY
jgi:hypothetical protein